jgi:predicted nucleotide-binding protein
MRERLEQLIERAESLKNSSSRSPEFIAWKTKVNHSVKNKKVFIVHGKDEGVKAQVSKLVEKMKLKPIILHEHANKGQTVIEKFEKHTDVKAALVLFTGDDIGKYKDDDQEENVRGRMSFLKRGILWENSEGKTPSSLRKKG